MPPGTAISDDLYPSDWQVKVVMNEQNVLVFHVIIIGTGPDRFATLVHEGQRAEKHEFFTLKSYPDIHGLETTTGQAYSQTPAPQINYLKTYVMPRVFVSWPGITEAYDQVHFLRTFIHPLSLNLIFRHSPLLARPLLPQLQSLPLQPLPH